jgi:ABC-2 type transport system ATP-binding protein
MMMLLLLCFANINYYYANFKNISMFDLYGQNLIIGFVLFVSIITYFDSEYFTYYFYIIFNIICFLFLIFFLIKIFNQKHLYGYERKIIYDVSHPYIDVENVICKGTAESHYIDNFSIESGVLLLKGNNGVGKSELLKVIGGFSSDVINYNKINTVGTSVIVSDWQNISYAQTEKQFYDRVFRFNGINNDFKDYLDKRKLLVDYSTGNFKYIKIVLAFLLEPQIIILDEPFENLDDSKIKKVIELINQNKKDKIIIITTHINGLDFNPDQVIEFRKKND